MIQVKYQYVADIKTEFNFDAVLPVDLSKVTWIVQLNGVDTKNYLRVDLLFVIDANVSKGQPIKIIARY